ncbi:MAG: hypothetical protein WCT31_03725 [Candidatus Micrarchaeia archaeon]
MRIEIVDLKNFEEIENQNWFVRQDRREYRGKKSHNKNFEKNF